MKLQHNNLPINPITVTPQNYYTNFTIHDEIGDPDNNSIWYFYQDVSGLEKLDGVVTMLDIFQLIIDHELSILDASEINLDTVKYHVREKIHSTVKSFPGSKVTYSSSKIQPSNDYRSGGVLQFSNGRINNRFIPLFQDEMGR